MLAQPLERQVESTACVAIQPWPTSETTACLDGKRGTRDWLAEAWGSTRRDAERSLSGACWPKAEPRYVGFGMGQA